MSGIATSLSRYTPIYNSPFSDSLNLGARFLLGGRIVTTTTRTVREVTADSPRGVAQIFIWMGVGPTRQSSLLPLSFQSRAELELPRQRSLSPSISLLRPPNLDSLHGNIPRHLLHLPKPLNRLLPGRNLSTTAGHHWRCLKLAPPPIRLSGRPPLEPTAGMDSW